MDWIVLVDLFFLTGALTAAGLLLYGGWLCVEQKWRDGESPESLEARLRPETPKAAPDEDGEGTVAGWVTMSLVGACLALLAPGAIPWASAADPLEQGLRAYEEGRYAEAVAQLRLAADAGNGRAQEILGFMYLHGPSLYGAAVQSDRAQAARWFRYAAQGGREVSQHMLCVLEGRPAQTVAGRAACGHPGAALGAPGPDATERAAASRAGTR